MGRPKGSKNKPKVQDGTPISNKTVNTAASTSTSKSKAAPKTTKVSTAKTTKSTTKTKNSDCSYNAKYTDPANITPPYKQYTA